MQIFTKSYQKELLIQKLEHLFIKEPINSHAEALDHWKNEECGPFKVRKLIENGDIDLPLDSLKMKDNIEYAIEKKVIV